LTAVITTEFSFRIDILVWTSVLQQVIGTVLSAVFTTLDYAPEYHKYNIGFCIYAEAFFT
jgi:hypothetical protein